MGCMVGEGGDMWLSQEQNSTFRIFSGGESSVTKTVV